MKPATHRGSCQCCGSVQKLPEGVLSKHGYTTRWGFFSGTCTGSGSLPYEQSFDLIARFVALAEAKLADLEAFRARLLETPAEGTTSAWVNVYRRGTFHMKAHHAWIELPLTFTAHTAREGDFRWLTVTYEHPDSLKAEPVPFYGLHTDNPLDYVRSANQKRAQALEPEIAQVERYIAWQAKRVADWKETPLLPLEGRIAPEVAK